MKSLILSFFAGLALNFMPCVLPIMLIKLYDILKYSQTINNKKNLKIVALSTSCGIIFIFSIFSFINIIFKHAGKTFNFGFHFQNPYFLIIVIFLLFLFFLNLLNVFDVHYSTRIIDYIQRKYERSKKLKKGIFIENFFTAIFMVLFATPCSLPIIGTVATFSLMTNRYLYIFYNFLSMGLGMSIPFIILLVKPNFVDFLKNKKKLLYVVHIIIIFSLFLTILWLLNVLYNIIGKNPTIIFICFLLILFIQFKFVKHFFQRLILVISIIIIGTILPMSMFREKLANKIKDGLWINNVTMEEIDNYVEQGKIVFVNISAKWCIICNLNNITVFSRYDVINLLNQDNIVPVLIDVTQNTDKAKMFYEDNKIYVPKYIIFSKKNTKGCTFSGQISYKQLINNLLLDKCVR